MSEEFNPYLKWLGIPVKHQPPHHYRLLGLEALENDLDAIENAADRQMAHLRTLRSGKRAEFAERLLNEIAEAKVCLLNVEKKREYDAKLREIEAQRKAADELQDVGGRALKSAVLLDDEPSQPAARKIPPGPSARTAAAAPPPKATAPAAPAPLVAVALEGAATPGLVGPARTPARRGQQVPWIAIAVVGAVVVGVLGIGAIIAASFLPSSTEVAGSDSGSVPSTTSGDAVANDTNRSLTGVAADEQQPSRVEGSRERSGERTSDTSLDNRQPDIARPDRSDNNDVASNTDRPSGGGFRRSWRGDRPFPWRDPRDRESSDFPRRRPTTDSAGETGGDVDGSDNPLDKPAPLSGIGDDDAGQPGAGSSNGDAPVNDLAQRLAVPTAAVQKEIEARVRSVYNSTPATTFAEQGALARKLIADAEETRDSPDDQFVMLRVAAESAAARADLTTAMQAVDALAARFEIEAMPLRLKLVEQASKVSLPPVERAQALRDSLPVIDSALAENKFAEVDELTVSLLAAARRLSDRELTAALVERRKSALAMKKQYDAAVAALETLKANPDDAAASGIVGSFWALVKDNWDKGLPYLAKSSAATHAAAAKRELAQSEAGQTVTADDMAALADEWFAIAAREEAPAKFSVLRHAAALYQRAQPEATGLTKASIDRQLAEIDKLLADAGAPRGTPASAVAHITASCDSSFELYINGEFLTRGNREEIAEVNRELKSGDVLLAMGSNQRNERGFAAVIKFEGSGKTIVTGQPNSWFAYSPASVDAWFDPQGVRNISSPIAGDGDRHQRIENQTGIRSQSIWGNNLYRAYFVLQVP